MTFLSLLHSPLAITIEDILLTSWILCMFIRLDSEQPIIFLQLWALQVIKRVSEQCLKFRMTFDLLDNFPNSAGFLLCGVVKRVFRMWRFGSQLLALCFSGYRGLFVWRRGSWRRGGVGDGLTLQSFCFCRGGCGGVGEDTGRLEDGETKNCQEEVESEGQTRQNQIDGASGATPTLSDHAAGNKRDKQRERETFKIQTDRETLPSLQTWSWWNRFWKLHLHLNTHAEVNKIRKTPSEYQSLLWSNWAAHYSCCVKVDAN